MPDRNPVAGPWLSLLWVAAALGFLVAERAHAQQRDADEVATRPLAEAVRVSAGETCLDEGRLQRRIGRWLERDAIDARITILVSGGPGATDVRFVVQRQGETPAERILDAVPEPCDQLHAAVALSIALSIDATLLGQGELSDDEALGDDPEPEPAPEPPTGPLGPQHDGMDYRPEVSVLAAGGIASGIVPGEAPVARVIVGFSPFRWVDLRLGAVAAVGAERGFDRAPGTYRADVYAGRLDLCLVAHVADAVRLAGCLGAQLGTFVTRGQGPFPEGGEQHGSLWSAAVAGVAAEASLVGPLGLGLDVDFNAPMQGRRIQVQASDGTARAFEDLPPLAFSATLGPVLRFDL